MEKIWDYEETVVYLTGASSIADPHFHGLVILEGRFLEWRAWPIGRENYRLCLEYCPGTRFLDNTPTMNLGLEVASFARRIVHKA